MSWLVILVFAYFILSINNFVDKIFLSTVVTASVVYVLWVNIVSVLGTLILVVAYYSIPPVQTVLQKLGGLTTMTPWFLLVSVAVGIAFALAMYLLYTALQKGEASRVVPLVGGSTPVLLLLFTLWFEPLKQSYLLAFVLLVIGTVLISFSPLQQRTAQSHRALLLAVGAACSFAVFYILTQYLFRHQGFLNGMVWPRLGSMVYILVLFLVPRVRYQMRESVKSVSHQVQGAWFVNQVLAAIGFLSQQYVISLPGVSIALVTAMQGVQYSFLLLFTTICTFIRPTLIREFIAPRVLLQKLLAIGCIVIGLYFITI